MLSKSSYVVLVVKNPPADEGDIRNVGLIPGSGRSPGEGNGNPLQISCLENPMIEEPGGLQSTGLQRARHNWSALAHFLKKNLGQKGEMWKKIKLESELLRELSKLEPENWGCIEEVWLMCMAAWVESDIVTCWRHPEYLPKLQDSYQIPTWK